MGSRLILAAREHQDMCSCRLDNEMRTCMASSRTGYHAGGCTCLHLLLHVCHMCELLLRCVCIAVIDGAAVVQGLH